MIEKYYKIKFKLLEPLSVGNGKNQYSDSDIIRDGRGDPFIPGTSLCGAYREYFESDEADRYFGKKINPEENPDDRTTRSKVIVYDAKMPAGESCITEIRDNVGLDDFKTPKEGAKFDFELVQPGAIFVTYIEQKMNPDETDVGSTIAQKMYAGDLCLGHKAMRGCGRVKATEVYTREFVLPDEVKGSMDGVEKRDLDKWLDFDMYAEDAFSVSDKIEPDSCRFTDQNLIRIELELQQRGGISIRRYTTELTENSENQPDYVQLHYVCKEKNEPPKEIPFIPGTSWSGAFRHHITELLSAQNLENANHIVEKYFGFVKPKKKQETMKETKDDDTLKQKSLIRFSESKITGDTVSKIITRTAIDRFSGGTVNGAMYTEKTFFNGRTSLTITFPRLNDEGENDCIFRQSMAASIADLHAGFLAVGGLTSVGRGLFRITKCIFNGKEISIGEDAADSKPESKVTKKDCVTMLYDDLKNAMDPKIGSKERGDGK